MSMDLGAYAQFIVPAYAITALALGGLVIWAWTSWRAVKAKLAALERAQEKCEAVFHPGPRPNEEVHK